MSRLKRFVLVLIVVAISPIHLFAQATSSSKPIPIKVVIVAMFERGEDTGDTPGEYQLWVEREHLDQIMPLPSPRHLPPNHPSPIYSKASSTLSIRRLSVGRSA